MGAMGTSLGIVGLSALTIGIALGSWWAYYELGWGGWWFWDPVENASLMPWLAATALMHSVLVVEKRGQLEKLDYLAGDIVILALFGWHLYRPFWPADIGP